MLEKPSGRRLNWNECFQIARGFEGCEGDLRSFSVPWGHGPNESSQIAILCGDPGKQNRRGAVSRVMGHKMSGELSIDSMVMGLALHTIGM